MEDGIKKKVYKDKPKNGAMKIANAIATIIDEHSKKKHEEPDGDEEIEIELEAGEEGEEEGEMEKPKKSLKKKIGMK